MSDTAISHVLEVRRLPVRVQGDPARTMLRFFWPGEAKARHLFERVMHLGLAEVASLLAEVVQRYEPRHADLESHFRRNAQELAERLRVDLPTDEAALLLLGSCASMEYSIEAAALFNPSAVEDVDQAGLAPGERRFVMSMRAVGEGHISSIVFRRGVVSAGGDINLTPPAAVARQAAPVPNPRYPRAALERTLRQINKLDATTQAVIDSLEEHFSYEQVLAVLQRLRERGLPDIDAASQLLIWLAKSNYKIEISPAIPLNEVVLFPTSEAESHGIEDMRLVRLRDDDGQLLICGTYTAFSGNSILPQMLLYRPGESQVQVVTLLGRFATDKGLALFPRRVNGRYLMLGRCDGENHYLLESDELHIWDRGRLLSGPAAAWEIVQVGNCGSPIETPEGWLVLTHGVGPLRRYCIGAMLLDLHDPARIIARLHRPLLEPSEGEGGYVPNVVYSCGAMLHGDTLLIPYGVSDTACGFASVSLSQLLHSMG